MASSSDPPGALPTPPKRPPRPRAAPTRRPALSVEEIVTAAIAVLDESGVAGLSMRRVAGRLDTGAASLYAYISGKDELVELIYDELVGRVALPTPDPARWRDQLMQMMRDLHDVLASHRDAALAGLGRVPTSPQTLTAAECVVAVMRSGGLSDRVVALGLDQLILYVSAAAYEAGLQAYGDVFGGDVERYYQEIHDFYIALPPDRFPVLASIADDMTGSGHEERFEFGVGMVIDGLLAIAQRRRGPAPPDPSASG